MVKHIPVYCRRRHLWVGWGIFVAFVLMIAPVHAAITFPAVNGAAPVVPPDLSPGERAALTVEQKVARAVALSEAAKFKATQALETGELALAQEAQALAREAVVIICQLSDFALENNNKELAQAALDASIRVGEALDIIKGASKLVASTSRNPARVAAGSALLATAESIQYKLSMCRETSLAAGASMKAAMEAYEASESPPGVPGFNPAVVGGEPPITDLPPATPV